MSLTIHAFLAKKTVPTLTQWQQSISELGYQMMLDVDFKPLGEASYLSCKLTNIDSGFGIAYETSAEVLAAYPQLKAKVNNYDFCISFSWSDDLAECACVLIASLALIEISDAVIYYPDDDMLLSKTELVEQINDCMELIKL